MAAATGASGYSQVEDFPVVGVNMLDPLPEIAKEEIRINPDQRLGRGTNEGQLGLGRPTTIPGRLRHTGAIQQHRDARHHLSITDMAEADPVRGGRDKECGRSLRQKVQLPGQLGLEGARHIAEQQQWDTQSGRRDHGATANPLSETGPDDDNQR